MKNYELFEHTADTGVRVKAKDLKGVFINSAFALFNIIAEKKAEARTNAQKINLKQKAQNREELFFNWLSELLSLSAAKGLIFTDFKIIDLKDDSLEALAEGASANGFIMLTEVKAVTYHNLKIEKIGFLWQAEFILDV